MHRKNRFRKDLFRRANHGFQVAFVGVLARALAELDDERRLALDVAFEQANCLLQIIDVVSAEGVFAVGDLEQLRGGDNHLEFSSINYVAHQLGRGATNYVCCSNSSGRVPHRQTSFRA